MRVFLLWGFIVFYRTFSSVSLFGLTFMFVFVKDRRATCLGLEEAALCSDVPCVGCMSPVALAGLPEPVQVRAAPGAGVRTDRCTSRMAGPAPGMPQGFWSVQCWGRMAGAGACQVRGSWTALAGWLGWSQCWLGVSRCMRYLGIPGEVLSWCRPEGSQSTVCGGPPCGTAGVGVLGVQGSTGVGVLGARGSAEQAWQAGQSARTLPPLVLSRWLGGGVNSCPAGPSNPRELQPFSHPSVDTPGG